MEVGEAGRGGGGGEQGGGEEERGRNRDHQLHPHQQPCLWHQVRARQEERNHRRRLYTEEKAMVVAAA